MQYSGERFTTGVDEIDDTSTDKSTDISDYQLLMEDGNKLLLEYYNASSIILESFVIQSILPNVQNDNFTSEISVLDFSEHNPFGEVL